jgi:transcriptional regulator with XRE-family HTH domain
LGSAIRVARRATGLTQEALGRRLGLKGRAIYRWERNETAPNHRHRRALLREIQLFSAEAATQLQTLFTERTGKTHNVIAESAALALVPSQPQQANTNNIPHPFVDTAPADTVATQTHTEAARNDALDVAILRMADELDISPRRARRALARLLGRVQSAHVPMDNFRAEVERLVARD